MNKLKTLQTTVCLLSVIVAISNLSITAHAIEDDSTVETTFEVPALEKLIPEIISPIEMNMTTERLSLLEIVLDTTKETITKDNPMDGVLSDKHIDGLPLASTPDALTTEPKENTPAQIPDAAPINNDLIKAEEKDNDIADKIVTAVDTKTTTSIGVAANVSSTTNTKTTTTTSTTTSTKQKKSDLSSEYIMTRDDLMKNVYVIYTSLIDYGMTNDQAVGILINMYYESRFIPSMVQGKWADPDYGKSISDPSSLKGGVGLVQWSLRNYKRALNENKGNHNWYDLDYQMSFLLSENDPNWETMRTYVSETASLDAVNCTRWFTKNFERCSGTETSSSYKNAGTPGTHYYKRWHSAETDVQEMSLVVAKCSEYASHELDELIESILIESLPCEEK